MFWSEKKFFFCKKRILIHYLSFMNKFLFFQRSTHCLLAWSPPMDQPRNSMFGTQVKVFQIKLCKNDKFQEMANTRSPIRLLTTPRPRCLWSTAKRRCPALPSVCILSSIMAKKPEEVMGFWISSMVDSQSIQSPFFVCYQSFHFLWSRRNSCLFFLCHSNDHCLVDCLPPLLSIPG